jgi:hypothetical protein
MTTSMVRLPLSAVAAAACVTYSAELYAEPWDYHNDPVNLDPTFQYQASTLPTSGTASVLPHPGWFWSTWQDSIDYRWNGLGTLAPAEKYAFLSGAMDFVHDVSTTYGVLSEGTLACHATSDCPSGMSCGLRPGSSGVCIPDGNGICNGWAGFAMQEPSARDPVTRDGVTFFPGDIDGLMSLLYANAPYRLVGDRCNGSVAVDGAGREVDSSCRNLNAGAFHVALANLLGSRAVAFAVNEDSQGGIWNRPAFDYQLKNAQGGAHLEVDAPTAMAILGLNATQVTVPADPTSTTTGGGFVAPSDGRYVFRATSSSGAIVLDMQKADGPSCDSATGGGEQVCVLDLRASDSLGWSISGPGAGGAQLALVTPGTPSPYVYDAAATRFFFVGMQVSLVGTIPASQTPTTDPRPTAHVHEYQWVLETDDAGTVLGGEWAASSKVDHPNYAWALTGFPAGAAHVLLSYEDAKSLLDESTGARRNHLSHLVNPRILTRRAGALPRVSDVP